MDDLVIPRMIQTYPLTKYTDMDEDLQIEASDMSVIACEKFANNYESAAKMIKEAMEKRFGPMWHAVVGESYGFEVTHDVGSMMHMYYGGNIAVVVWRV